MTEWRRHSASIVSLLLIGGLFFELKVFSIDQYLMISKSLKKSMLQSGYLAEEPVHLMYASDDNSLIGVQASIRSVMKHASEPVVFHYVGNSPIPALPEVKFYNLTEVATKHRLDEYTNLYERSESGYQGINANLPNYARFTMDSLLPQDVTKAMWIDADTIVVCDVVSMVRNVLNDEDSPNIIAAVPGNRSPRGFAKNVKEKYGITKSFNAGAYVVDLTKWRAQNISKKIRKIAQKNRKKHMYNLGSQAPLILAMEDNFEPLDWVWNAKVSHFENPDKRENEKEACLLHWSGRDKPWHVNGTRYDLWKPYEGDS